jgi:hypothetical protein
MATKEQEAFLRSLEEEKSEAARARASRFGRFTRRAAVVAPSGGGVILTLAAGQASRTNAGPINFTATFNPPVASFTNADVSLAGSTVGGTLVAAVTGTNPYNIAVTGMVGGGIVAASIIPRAGSAGGSGAIAPVKSASGTNTAATVAPAFGSPSTAGNLIVLSISGDAGVPSVGSGWQQSANMGQVGDNGGYLWWRISAGETTFPSYTMSVATNSSWTLTEFAGCTATPYDVSLGQHSETGVALYTTPALTPSAGSRVLVAAMLGSSTIDLSGAFTAWLNSFTQLAGIGQSAGTIKTCAAVAYRLVTGDGATPFSSGVTWPALCSGNVGLIAAFKGGASGAVSPLPGAPARFVMFDTTGPSVTINQAAGQADPVSAEPINFTAVFSSPVTGFTSADVSLTGSTATGTLTVAVTGSGATYNVAVSGMVGVGNVTASIPAGGATDMAGNGNLASTSTDNTVAFNPAIASPIPMSYNDPIFASTTPGTNGQTLSSGASLVDKSFPTSNAGNASIVCLGANTLQRCRFGAPGTPVREGPRVAGGGTLLFDQCYIDVDGVGDDHADGIQAFSPGNTGTIFLNNTFIRAYRAGEGPGGSGSVGTFIADNWTGTFKCRNVIFHSGEFGCRAFPDIGGDMHIDFDTVYFVGPYQFAAFDIGGSFGGHITVIDRWTNVFNATIVGGAIVPGSAIPPPI